MTGSATVFSVRTWAMFLPDWNLVLFFFFFLTFVSVQKRVFVSICDQCMPLPLVFPSSFRRQTPQRWLTIPKVAHRKQLFSKDFRLSSLSSVQFQIGENHYETGSNKIGYAFRLGNCGKCRDVRLDVCLSCVLREPDKMWEMGESKVLWWLTQHYTIFKKKSSQAKVRFSCH